MRPSSGRRLRPTVFIVRVLHLADRTSLVARVVIRRVLGILRLCLPLRRDGPGRARLREGPAARDERRERCDSVFGA